MLDVLEHLKDDRQGLREARRVLRERGALVVSVPLHPCLWSRHDEAMGHFRRYRPGEVSRLAREAGFSVVYRTCWNAPGVVGAVVRKTGLAIEKATVAARPFLWAESWVVTRIPSAVGLSEFVVAVRQKAVQAQRKTA
jgi:SAM-dependent methyltransferase